MSKLKGIPITHIKARLDYNPSSGELRWRNGQRAGKLAGCVTQNAAGNKYYYLSLGYQGKTYNFLSHILCFAIHFERQEFSEIDHLDGNGLNNSIQNLREVTRSINNKNHRLQRNSSSGVTGVSYRKSKDDYRVYSGYGGKQIHIGVFKDFFEACCSRKSYELKHNFTERHGR